MTNEQRYRNEFARRSFLEIADYDYVSARILFKYHCYEQCMVTSQQSIEKYLKAILLFQSVKPKNSNRPNHNLGVLMAECLSINNLVLSEDTMKFIKALNGVENIRYLTNSYFLRGDLLRLLDKVVFELRVYCSYGSNKVAPLYKNINAISKYQNGRLVFGGNLEKIIKAKADSNHFSNKERLKLKKILFWKNSMLTGEVYTTDEMYRAKVAPLEQTGIINSDGVSIDHAIYEAIEEYVYLPKSTKNLF